MRITVKLFAYFRDGRFKTAEREYPPGTTVGSIVDGLGISQDEVGVLMLNSRHCEFTSKPAEGDALAIFPVIGGG
jgi:sulfur-carrier protein